MGRRKTRVPRTVGELPGYEVIEQMAARGHREIDIARRLGIMSWSTWTRIKDEDPKALAALEAGRGVEHDRLYGRLFEKAMRGDTIALLFLLKTRHNYNDRPEPAPVQAAVQINMPSPLGLEDYTRLIAQVKPVTLVEGEVASDG